VAAHGADANTNAIDWNRGGGVENLVGFGIAFPLLAALAVFDLAIDPGEKVPRKGETFLADS
jgi:hypothetical protein